METTPIGIVVAFTAGALSFLSPCVLPLIPSYVTFITGMSLDELTTAHADRKRVRRAVLLHGSLFVVGFTGLFVLGGASLGYLSSGLAYYSRWLERAGGVLLVGLGLYLLGLLRLPGASREWRVHLSDKPLGYLGTLGVGIAFGAGWTPCLGPIISGIMTMAATGGTATAGEGLLLVYSAGLALPFLASALMLDRFLSGTERFRRWLPWINRISGLMLVLVGFLLLVGSFTVLAAYLNRLTPGFLLERL